MIQSIVEFVLSDLFSEWTKEVCLYVQYAVSYEM